MPHSTRRFLALFVSGAMTLTQVVPYGFSQVNDQNVKPGAQLTATVSVTADQPEPVDDKPAAEPPKDAGTSSEFLAQDAAVSVPDAPAGESPEIREAVQAGVNDGTLDPEAEKALEDARARLGALMDLAAQKLDEKPLRDTRAILAAVKRLREEGISPEKLTVEPVVKIDNPADTGAGAAQTDVVSVRMTRDGVYSYVFSIGRDDEIISAQYYETINNVNYLIEEQKDGWTIRYYVSNLQGDLSGFEMTSGTRTVYVNAENSGMSIYDPDDRSKTTPSKSDTIDDFYARYIKAAVMDLAASGELPEGRSVLNLKEYTVQTSSNVTQSGGHGLSTHSFKLQSDSFTYYYRLTITDRISVQQLSKTPVDPARTSLPQEALDAIAKALHTPAENISIQKAEGRPIQSCSGMICAGWSMFVSLTASFGDGQKQHFAGIVTGGWGANLPKALTGIELKTPLAFNDTSTVKSAVSTIARFSRPPVVDLLAVDPVLDGRAVDRIASAAGVPISAIDEITFHIRNEFAPCKAENCPKWTADLTVSAHLGDALKEFEGTIRLFDKKQGDERYKVSLEPVDLTPEEQFPTADELAVFKGLKLFGFKGVEDAEDGTRAYAFKALKEGSADIQVVIDPCHGNPACKAAVQLKVIHIEVRPGPDGDVRPDLPAVDVDVLTQANAEIPAGFVLRLVNLPDNARIAAIEEHPAETPDFVPVEQMDKDLVAKIRATVGSALELKGEKIEKADGQIIHRYIFRAVSGQAHISMTRDTGMEVLLAPGSDPYHAEYFVLKFFGVSVNVNPELRYIRDPGPAVFEASENQAERRDVMPGQEVIVVTRQTDPSWTPAESEPVKVFALGDTFPWEFRPLKTEEHFRLELATDAHVNFIKGIQIDKFDPLGAVATPCTPESKCVVSSTYAIEYHLAGSSETRYAKGTMTETTEKGVRSTAYGVEEAQKPEQKYPTGAEQKIFDGLQLLEFVKAETGADGVRSYDFLALKEGVVKINYVFDPCRNIGPMCKAAVMLKQITLNITKGADGGVKIALYGIDIDVSAPEKEYTVQAGIHAILHNLAANGEITSIEETPAPAVDPDFVPIDQMDPKLVESIRAAIGDGLELLGMKKDTATQDGNPASDYVFRAVRGDNYVLAASMKSYYEYAEIHYSGLKISVNPSLNYIKAPDPVLFTMSEKPVAGFEVSIGQQIVLRVENEWHFIKPVEPDGYFSMELSLASARPYGGVQVVKVTPGSPGKTVCTAEMHCTTTTSYALEYVIGTEPVLHRTTAFMTETTDRTLRTVTYRVEDDKLPPVSYPLAEEQKIFDSLDLVRFKGASLGSGPIRFYSFDAVKEGTVKIRYTVDPCRNMGDACKAAVTMKEITLTIKKPGEGEAMILDAWPYTIDVNNLTKEYSLQPGMRFSLGGIAENGEITSIEETPAAPQQKFLPPLKVVDQFSYYPHHPYLADGASYQAYVFRAEELAQGGREGVLVLTRDGQPASVVSGKQISDIPACSEAGSFCVTVQLVDNIAAPPVMRRLYAKDAGSAVALAKGQFLRIDLAFGGYTAEPNPAPKLPEGFPAGELTAAEKQAIEGFLQKEGSQKAALADLTAHLGTEAGIKLFYQYEEPFEESNGEWDAVYKIAFNYDKVSGDIRSFGDYLYTARVKNGKVTLVPPQNLPVPPVRAAVPLTVVAQEDYYPNPPMLADGASYRKFIFRAGEVAQGQKEGVLLLTRDGKDAQVLAGRKLEDVAACKAAGAFCVTVKLVNFIQAPPAVKRLYYSDNGGSIDVAEGQLVMLDLSFGGYTREPNPAPGLPKDFPAGTLTDAEKQKLEAFMQKEGSVKAALADLAAHLGSSAKTASVFYQYEEPGEEIAGKWDAVYQIGLKVTSDSGAILNKYGPDYVYAARVKDGKVTLVPPANLPAPPSRALDASKQSFWRPEFASTLAGILKLNAGDLTFTVTAEELEKASKTAVCMGPGCAVLYHITVKTPDGKTYAAGVSYSWDHQLYAVIRDDKGNVIGEERSTNEERIVPLEIPLISVSDFNPQTLTAMPANVDVGAEGGAFVSLRSDPEVNKQVTAAMDVGVSMLSSASVYLYSQAGLDLPKPVVLGMKALRDTTVQVMVTDIKGSTWLGFVRVGTAFKNYTLNLDRAIPGMPPLEGRILSITLTCFHGDSADRKIELTVHTPGRTAATPKVQGRSAASSVEELFKKAFAAAQTPPPSAALTKISGIANIGFKNSGAYARIAGTGTDQVQINADLRHAANAAFEYNLKAALGTALSLDSGNLTFEMETADISGAVTDGSPSVLVEVTDANGHKASMEVQMSSANKRFNLDLTGKGLDYSKIAQITIKGSRSDPRNLRYSFIFRLLGLAGLSYGIL